MRLFVGIPAYDRKIHVETARSLLFEQGAATQAGIGFDVCLAPGSSLITQARDHLVARFLESGANKLVFIDADVAWEPCSLIKLAMHDRDFVAGVYRYKSEPEKYPIRWLSDRKELWADDDGLLEVEGVATGFLAIKREVFARLREAQDRREYQHGPDTFYPWFHMPPGKGEDYAFCDDWRAVGGQIFIDPTLTLSHCEGPHKYTGCIGDWLKNRTE